MKMTECQIPKQRDHGVFSAAMVICEFQVDLVGYSDLECSLRNGQVAEGGTYCWHQKCWVLSSVQCRGGPGELNRKSEFTAFFPQQHLSLPAPTCPGRSRNRHNYAANPHVQEKNVPLWHPLKLAKTIHKAVQMEVFLSHKSLTRRQYLAICPLLPVRLKKPEHDTRSQTAVLHSDGSKLSCESFKL